MAAAGAIAGIGATAFGAWQQAEAIKQKAEFDRRQAEANRDLANAQAEDAERRGNTESTQQIAKGRRLEASQRVQLAAGGQAGTSTAQDILGDTNFMTTQDATRIKNNAAREAWGYRVQAANIEAQSGYDQISASTQRRNTLLTGGLTAASSGVRAYGDFKK